MCSLHAMFFPLLPSFIFFFLLLLPLTILLLFKLFPILLLSILLFVLVILLFRLFHILHLALFMSRPRFRNNFQDFSNTASTFNFSSYWLSSRFRSNRAGTCSSRSALTFLVPIPLHPSMLLLFYSWSGGIEFPIRLLAAVHFFPAGL